MLTTGIVLSQIAVNEWSVHARRRNAVAANFMRQIILGYGIGHGYHGALAHGIREAISERRGAGDGCHVQNHAAPPGRHVADRSVRAVVDALYVAAEDSVEISFRGGFHRPPMGDARIVDENIEAFMPR